LFALWYIVGSYILNTWARVRDVAGNKALDRTDISIDDAWSSEPIILARQNLQLIINVAVDDHY
jgi:hypothetical protein